MRDVRHRHPTDCQANTRLLEVKAQRYYIPVSTAQPATQNGSIVRYCLGIGNRRAAVATPPRAAKGRHTDEKYRNARDKETPSGGTGRVLKERKLREPQPQTDGQRGKLRNRQPMIAEVNVGLMLIDAIAVVVRTGGEQERGGTADSPRGNGG